MSSKLTEASISNCQAKFNLSYHVLYAYWCQQLVGFEGKNVLEVGGSLPKEFVFDYLDAESWSAIESPDYEIALKEIGTASQGSNLYNIEDYSKLSFNIEKLSKYNLFAST
ncbi:MAG: hypothetical protein CLLPBCKN_004713 [Chroococcidiopsis cubana SAG 39.79]|uniref:hypothetical protein n=1 Tax=Chroococcidiopsis cubana TaxID=171392 RepID=UPI002AC5EF73|nr:hypothetical protein [Chroococcidiopsis cubana]MDZ4875317.1 hypothetical protein [Chroococcidiopsis cubana SAG 39.79]